MNIEQIQHTRKYNRNYRLKNREKINERKRKYRLLNKEKQKKLIKYTI